MSDGMSQEEFDARSDTGEDAHALVGEGLQRQGYVLDGGRYISPVEQENRALREGLLYLAGYDVAGWEAHMRPDEVLKKLGVEHRP